MNIRNVINKDMEYFHRLNEEINLYADKYGENVAKSYYKTMLNEEGEEQQQPAQQQDASQNNNQQQDASQNNAQQQQQPAVDNQKMLQEFGQIGEQMQKFVQTYANSPKAKELNDLLTTMKNLSQAMKTDAQQQQNNAQQQQPAQQQQQQ